MDSNSLLSIAALFVAYTLYHLFNLFKVRVNTTVAANTKDVEILTKKLDETQTAFNAYRLDAQYQAGKRDSDIAHLNQQIATLESHKNDLARLLATERTERAAERVRYQAEIDELKRRITELEHEKAAFLKVSNSNPVTITEPAVNMPVPVPA